MPVTRAQLKIEGMDALLRRLERLSGPRLKKISQSMLTTGAGIVKEEAKRQVPVRTGNLKAGIALRKLKVRLGETAAVRIYCKGKLASHSSLVQLGTKDRYRGTSSIRTVKKQARRGGRGRIVAFRTRTKGKRVGYTGKMPANPFFAEALEDAKQEAIKKMENRLRSLLRKELQAV